MTTSDVDFSASIAENYQRWMVPNYFQPYAQLSAALIKEWQPAKILEVGAGTGILTRELAAALPDAQITAIDLNPAMVNVGRSLEGVNSRTEWMVADAVALPAAGESVNVVAAQFVAMFFPDRLAAFAEMHRILAVGGRLLMTVWGPIEGIPVDLVAEGALAEMFPKDPPSFIRRVPHGYHRPEVIRENLLASGFHSFTIETEQLSVTVPDVRDLAVALCTGTPIRTEIEARDPGGLAAAVDCVTQSLQEKFGSGAVLNKLSALVITAEK